MPRISTTKCPCGSARSYAGFSERANYNYWECNDRVRCGVVVKTIRPRTHEERVEEHHNGRNKRGKRLV